MATVIVKYSGRPREVFRADKNPASSKVRVDIYKRMIPVPLSVSQGFSRISQFEKKAKPRNYQEVIQRSAAIKTRLKESTPFGNPLDVLSKINRLQTMCDYLKESHTMVINATTGNGMSSLMAARRLNDMVHDRIRQTRNYKQNLTDVLQKFSKSESFDEIWKEYTQANAKTGREKTEAVRSLNGKLREILNTKRKRKVKFELPPLPDIHSATLLLPFTDWNDVSTAGATSLKNIIYRIAREFFASGYSIQDFLRSFDAAKFVSRETPATGEVTMVNGTLISLQLHSIEHLASFLEHLPKLVDHILSALLDRRKFLEEQIQLPSHGMPTRIELDENLYLTNQFSFDAAGEIVFNRFQKGQSQPVQIPVSQFGMTRIFAGVSSYAGQEDDSPSKDKLRNLTSIYKQVRQMRDDAIRFAEAKAKQLEQAGEKAAQARIAFDSLGSVMLNKIYFREGRLLNAEEILDGLLAIKYRDPDADKEAVSDRHFKQVSMNDLEKVAQEVANNLTNFLKAGGKINFPKGLSLSEMNPEILAQKWMDAIRPKKEEGAIRNREDRDELIKALQWSFLQPVTNPYVLALFIEMEGFVEPARLLRKVTNITAKKGLVGQIETAIDELMDLHNTTDELYIPDDLFAKIQLLENQFIEAADLIEKSGHDPRDGKNIFSMTELGPAVYNQFGNFYREMKKKNISLAGDKPGVIILGFEAQSAKVLDAEANKISEDHVIDANMILIRISTQETARRFNEWLEREYQGHVGYLEWAQGDEKVPVITSHLSNGLQVTNDMLAKFAELQREVLREYLPYVLHLEKKVKIQDNKVLRRKRWKVEGSLTNQTIAAAQDEILDPEASAWILEEYGQVLEFPRPVKLKDIQGEGFLPETGQVNMRLVALRMDFEVPDQEEADPEIAEQFYADFLRQMLFVMDLDNRVKEEEKYGKKTTEGVWIYDAETTDINQVMLAA